MDDKDLLSLPFDLFEFLDEVALWFLSIVAIVALCLLALFAKEYVL